MVDDGGRSSGGARDVDRSSDDAREVGSDQRRCERGRIGVAAWRGRSEEQWRRCEGGRRSSGNARGGRRKEVGAAAVVER